MSGTQNGKTVPLGTGTSTVSDCAHGKKVYKTTNYFTQALQVPEIMQRLFECHEACSTSGTEVRNMPQEPS